MGFSERIVALLASLSCCGSLGFEVMLIVAFLGMGEVFAAEKPVNAQDVVKTLAVRLPVPKPPRLSSSLEPLSSLSSG